MACDDWRMTICLESDSHGAEEVSPIGLYQIDFPQIPQNEILYLVQCSILGGFLDSEVIDSMGKVPRYLHKLTLKTKRVMR